MMPGAVSGTAAARAAQGHRRAAVPGPGVRMSVTPTLTHAPNPRGPLSAAVPRPARRAGRPRWTDPRLVAGLLLAVGSGLLGARALTAADDSEPVWAAARDLPRRLLRRAPTIWWSSTCGSPPARRRTSAGGQAPTGRSTLRAVSAGSSSRLPVLGRGPVPDHRLVTVPAETFHFPADLARGDRVDVYATTEQDGPPGPTSCSGMSWSPRWRRAAPGWAGSRGGRRAVGAGRRRAGRRGRDPVGRRRPGPRPRVGAVSHDQVPVLTALVDPSEEAALAAAWAGPGRPVRISRRCVDTADLLAAATTGQASAAVVSAGLPRLDLQAVAHLGAQGVAVVGLCADEAEERRLRMWGAAAVLAPGDGPDAIADAVLRAAGRRPGALSPIPEPTGPAAAAGAQPDAAP